MQAPLHICGVTVNHNTSHFVELMQEDLRMGRGMGRESSYESDWVKQQRQQP